MTIYTRFGSPVEILDSELDVEQTLWIKCQREDGEIIEWASYELRADGGWLEIQAELDKLKKN